MYGNAKYTGVQPYQRSPLSSKLSSSSPPSQQAGDDRKAIRDDMASLSTSMSVSELRKAILLEAEGTQHSQARITAGDDTGRGHEHDDEDEDEHADKHENSGRGARHASSNGDVLTESEKMVFSEEDRMVNLFSDVNRRTMNARAPVDTKYGRNHSQQREQHAQDDAVDYAGAATANTSVVDCVRDTFSNSYRHPHGHARDVEADTEVEGEGEGEEQRIARLLQPTFINEDLNKFSAEIKPSSSSSSSSHFKRQYQTLYNRRHDGTVGSRDWLVALAQTSHRDSQHFDVASAGGGNFGSGANTKVRT